MAEDYESMTVAQLKELLKEQDLPVSGKKSDLVARLQEAAGHDEVVEDEAPAEAAEDDNWDDEDWDDEDDDVYMVKQKPVLNDEMKAALALEPLKRRRHPRSAEPNGSATSVSPAPAGEPLTAWTTSNVATTSTEVRWCESATAKSPLPVSSTRLASVK